MLVYHLPDDYFSRVRRRTSRRSPPPTSSASRRSYIQPDRVAVVVVGDRKTIEPGIAALNLGPVKVLTVDDVFGAPTEVTLPESMCAEN